MVKIEWTEGAIKDLEKLDKPIVQRMRFEVREPKGMDG